MSLTRGLVLDVANQLGGAMPSVVTLHDWSRFENDGAMTDVTWEQLPSGLWMMRFNGTSSDVQIADSLSQRIPLNLTVLCWARTDHADTRYFFCKGDLGLNTVSWCVLNFNQRFRVFITQGGTYLGGDTKNYYTTADVFTDANIWHHVGFVFEGGTTLTLYVDGEVPATTYSTDNAMTSLYPATDDLLLGCVWINALKAGRAVIDKALPCIYNYALTPAQVRARYHSEKWLFGVAS